MALLESLQAEPGIKELWLNQYTTGFFCYPAHSQVHLMFGNQENQAPDKFSHRKYVREKKNEETSQYGSNFPCSHPGQLRWLEGVFLVVKLLWCSNSLETSVQKLA